VAKSKDEIFAYLTRLGFQYGPYFQLSERLWTNGVEALVEIHRTAPPSGGTQTELDPAIMDTVLRSAFLVQCNANSDTLRIPFSVEAVQSYGAIPDRCYAYVRVVGQQANGDLKTDISLLGVDGEEIIHFKG